MTYAQAVCGLRCLNILNGYQVAVSDEGEPQCIVVSHGTKEKVAMASVQQVL